MSIQSYSPLLRVTLPLVAYLLGALLIIDLANKPMMVYDSKTDKYQEVATMTHPADDGGTIIEASPPDGFLWVDADGNIFEGVFAKNSRELRTKLDKLELIDER